MITVEIPVIARRFVDHATHVRVPAEGTVEATLGGLFERFPSLERRLCAADRQLYGFVGVFVNDLDARQLGGAQAPVQAGDVITLVSALAGG